MSTGKPQTKQHRHPSIKHPNDDAQVSTVLDLRFKRIEGLPDARQPIIVEVKAGQHSVATSEAQTFDGRSVFATWLRVPIPPSLSDVHILVHGTSSAPQTHTPCFPGAQRRRHQGQGQQTHRLRHHQPRRRAAPSHRRTHVRTRAPPPFAWPFTSFCFSVHSFPAPAG